MQHGSGHSEVKLTCWLHRQLPLAHQANRQRTAPSTVQRLSKLGEFRRHRQPDGLRTRLTERLEAICSATSAWARAAP